MRLAGVAATWLAALSATPLPAQTFPTKPVRIVVGFPPGGATDLVARAIQPKLTASLGKQVVVDNRPGANGVIGLEVLARSEPDGHTVGIGHIRICATGQHTIDVTRSSALNRTKKRLAGCVGLSRHCHREQDYRQHPHQHLPVPLPFAFCPLTYRSSQIPAA